MQTPTIRRQHYFKHSYRRSNAIVSAIQFGAFEIHRETANRISNPFTDTQGQEL